jgi:hypothetical protein
LIASIGANVALGAILLLQDQGASPGTPSARTAQPPETSARERANLPPAEPAMAPAGILAFYDRLTAGGLPEMEAKRALLAWLEARMPEPPAKEYWRPAHLSDARERLARFQSREAVRAALLSAFGPSADADPAFSALFSPYRHEFPFLSPAKQRALEAIYASRDTALLGATTETASAVEASARSAVAEIEKLLAADELEQFRLRTSPLARQLLASGFQFSEQEFKSAFQALAASKTGEELTATSAFRIGSGTDETTGRLRTALGNRFEEYQKLQDPRYQILTAVSQSFGIATTQRDAAYAAIRAAEAAIETINKSGPVLMPDSRLKLSEIAQQREERLKHLLGTKAYEVTARSLGLNGSAAFPVATRPGRRAVAVKDFP